MFHYHLSTKSRNAKTGPIPVSTTSRNSCPPHCPLRKTVHGEVECYAEGGPLAWHWDKVTKGLRGTDLDTFCDQIRALPAGALWRHNQAGDFPGRRNRLHGAKIRKLTRANRGKKPIAYTHYPPEIGDNAEIIREANANGFTINLSADSLEEADRFKALGIAPVVVVLPPDQKTNLKTPAGNLVVVCPYEIERYRAKGVTCSKCRLCAWRDRNFIVGFPAEGTPKKTELVTIGGVA